MRALITGVNGFAGTHLSRYLKTQGVEVYGIIYPHVDRLPHDRRDILAADIRSGGALRRAVRTVRPDVVYHLAARAFVPEARENPAEAVDINIKGSINLLDAVRFEMPSARVILASSSDVYGMVRPADLPITERKPVMPVSVYAVTKASMESIARVYALDYDLDIVILRLFSHIGPGQSPSFVCSDFARQIALIEMGRRKPEIRVGSLKAKRDFTDVRDIARAYWLAWRRIGGGGCYNVASGRAISIGEIVRILKSKTRARFRIVQEKARLRKVDIPVIVGCSDRFRKATGWRPEIEIDKTIADTLEWWREKLQDIKESS